MSEAKRVKKCEKFYVNEAGELSRHAKADSVGVLFKFSDGTEVNFDPSKVNGDIAKQLLLHGAAQKIGDSHASKKELGDAVEAVETVIENLYEGKWIDRAEGMAPRTTVLAEAISRVKADKYPDVASAAAAVKEMDDDKRKAVSAIPQIKAAMEAIKAERAAERAAKLAEKAQSADAADLDSI